MLSYWSTLCAYCCCYSSCRVVPTLVRPDSYVCCHRRSVQFSAMQHAGVVRFIGRLRRYYCIAPDEIHRGKIRGGRAEITRREEYHDDISVTWRLSDKSRRVPYTVASGYSYPAECGYQGCTRSNPSCAIHLIRNGGFARAQGDDTVAAPPSAH